MKKTVAFFVCFLIIVLNISPVVMAVESESREASYTELTRDVVSYTCNYSADAEKIEIHGRVNYDALVSYSKYSIEIYKIAPKTNIEKSVMAKDVEPLATMAIAVKFDLSFDIESSADRFCRYAVVFRAPNGDAVLAAKPAYVNVGSGYKLAEGDKTVFKGISTDRDIYTSVFGDMGFGTAIIPIHYDRLLNPASNGYMYPHEDGYVYFDRTYIDGIASKVRTYSARGARVYLQLLLPAGDVELSGNRVATNVSSYTVPQVYDQDTASLISTFVKYLTVSFDEYTEGLVQGYVVGKTIDRTVGGGVINEYAQKYAYYLGIVASTARHENPNIDIVIPISDFDAYTDRKAIPANAYSPSLLLEELSDILDQNYAGGFSYNILLESTVVPIVKNEPIEPVVLNEETDGNANTDTDIGDITTLPEEDSTEETEPPTDLPTEDISEYSLADLTESERIGAANIDKYLSFVRYLQSTHMSAPNNTLFLWQVPSGIYGNALSLSYAYNYYKLLHIEGISTFAVAFEGDDTEAFDSIHKLVQKIDSSEGAAESSKLLHYLGIASWGELIEDFSHANVPIRKLFYTDTAKILKTQLKGGFTYIGFENGNTANWWGTSFTSSLRSDYDEEGRRALCQTIRRPAGLAHSDLIYFYEFDENLIYTPILSFELKITDAAKDGGLYEVTVSVGKGNSCTEAKYIIRSEETTELWLDASEFNALSKAGYIKISTRSITGSADDYILRLYNVQGFSTEHDSESLNELISNERIKIRDTEEEIDEDTLAEEIYWVVLIVVLTAVILISIMLIIFRKDTEHTERE